MKLLWLLAPVNSEASLPRLLHEGGLSYAAPMQGKLRSRCGSGHHLRGLLSHPRQKARSPARRSSLLGAAAETWRRRQKAAALAEPANTLARSRGRVSYGARNGVPQSCRSMPATDPRCKPFQAASRAVARLGSGPPMGTTDRSQCRQKKPRHHVASPELEAEAHDVRHRHRSNGQRTRLTGMDGMVVRKQTKGL